MLSTAYYFLQVLLCSAIMMGYYWVVLRNKRFHQYNRFYLLSVAILSWIIPLIKIQWTNSFGDNEQVIRFLTVVADNNTELESVVRSKGFHWGTESLISLLYFSVGIFLLMTMLHALYRIYQLLKKNPCRQIEDIFLIITQAKGTPFSFFRYIFWNDEIDIRSASGKQILQHELTHVQQRHSVDKMLIQLILVAGWFNPFFWLVKKEMDMIHEFIADKQSVRDGDTAALAKMLLTAVYPQQQFELTHPFFFSPIKRRLQMLTNHKNPRFSYLRRLVALPLLAVLIVLFAFRSKQSRIDKPISVASVVENVVGDFRAHVIGDPQKTFSAIPFKSFVFNKTYTIVINPGHGGEDVGAKGYDGTKESDLSLAFAKKIKELNSNPNIKVILTRETDVFNTVVKVAEIAEQFSPDLFISVHANNAPPIRSLHGKTKENPSKGAELYIASKDKAYDYENNYQFANMVGNMMSSVANPFLGIKSREKGVYVLQKLKCPSVLIETGFMSNKEELKLLKDESYQSKMALSILQGVEQYLAVKEKNKEIKVVDVDLDMLSNTSSSFEFVADKAVVKEDKVGNLQSLKLIDNPYLKFRDIYKSSEGLLLLLDGKRISYDQFNRLNSDMIQEITVIKDPVSIKALTDEEVKSIVQITTKRAEIQENGSPNYVITISHTKPIHNVVKVLYLHTDPPTVEGYDLKDPVSRNEFARKFAGEKGVDKLVKDAANYYPSKAEPKNIQPSTLATRIDHPADFTGGEIAWQKYLQKNLNRDIPIDNGAPAGKYVVKVTFIVQPNGIIKDLKVKEDPGFGTAEEVIRIITKGPKWRPAIYNQKTVASLVEKKVTFVISDESDTVKSKDVGITNQKVELLSNSTAKFKLIVDSAGNVRW
ncbi:MAG: N-acetylmuramoyl-L-alanine amidase [Chitinophagaceae bacterium]|nr:N-acetylmuramoyl-L-alanine amidase [Chitinophagaceae bacterium]